MRDHRDEDHRLIWFDPRMIQQMASAICVVCTSAGGAFILSCIILFSYSKSLLMTTRLHTDRWSRLQIWRLHDLCCHDNIYIPSRDALLGLSHLLHRACALGVEVQESYTPGSHLRALISRWTDTQACEHGQNDQGWEDTCQKNAREVGKLSIDRLR